MDDLPWWKRLVRVLATNEVEAGNSRWYPELEPHQYEASPETVFEAVCEVVDGHPRWTIASRDEERRRLEVEVRTSMLGFVDDVSVVVEPVEGESDKALVRAKSSSRLGHADFGQNARTLRQLYERIDQVCAFVPSLPN